jgi:hypothetical protein
MSLAIEENYKVFRTGNAVRRGEMEAAGRRVCRALSLFVPSECLVEVVVPYLADVDADVWLQAACLVSLAGVVEGGWLSAARQKADGRVLRALCEGHVADMHARPVQDAMAELLEAYVSKHSKQRTAHAISDGDRGMDRDNDVDEHESRTILVSLLLRLKAGRADCDSARNVAAFVDKMLLELANAHKGTVGHVDCNKVFQSGDCCEKEGVRLTEIGKVGCGRSCKEADKAPGPTCPDGERLIRKLLQSHLIGILRVWSDVARSPGVGACETGTACALQDLCAAVLPPYHAMEQTGSFGGSPSVISRGDVTFGDVGTEHVVDEGVWGDEEVRLFVSCAEDCLRGVMCQKGRAALLNACRAVDISVATGGRNVRAIDTESDPSTIVREPCALSTLMHELQAAKSKGDD